MVFHAADFVDYIVEKKTDNHYNIFKSEGGVVKTFICHKESQKQASKLAELLAKTYRDGFYDGSY